MAFALTNLIVRSRRRIRAIFSDVVAAGGFDEAFYAVTSLDGSGASPSINGVFMVPDSPQAVELSFAIDLAGDGAYRLTLAPGVPAQAGGTAAAATYDFRAPKSAPPPSPELPSDDALDAIYSNDIVFADDDFIETAEGDLATAGGIPNVVNALAERALSEGLPWDQSYGAKPRQNVDGPDTDIPALRARMIGEFNQDERVSSAKGSSTTNQDGEAMILIDVVLVGQANPVTVSVPVPGENA